MSQIGNKQIMAANIRRLMDRKGKDRTSVCNDLGFKYSTFSEWVNGVKYPRIDKIEIMANYFGVSKSALIEEYSPELDSIQADRTSFPLVHPPLPEMNDCPEEEQKNPTPRTGDGNTKKFVELFEKLDDGAQKYVISSMKGILSEQE